MVRDVDRFGVLAVLLGVAACGEGVPNLSEAASVAQALEAPRTANIVVDTTRDGVIDGRDDVDEDAFTAERGAVLLANVDDDDGDGQRDGREPSLTHADDVLDLAPAIVRQVTGLKAGDAVRVRVTPSAAAARVRIFQLQDDMAKRLFEPGDTAGVLPVDVVAAGDVSLLVEGVSGRSTEWDGNLQLTVEIVNGGTVVSRDTASMRAAPVIFPDNLNSPRALFVQDIRTGQDNNTAFLRSLRAEMPEGVALRTHDGDRYDRDRWVQDSMETGYQLAPSVQGTQELPTYLLTSRPRPLMDLLPKELLGKDLGYIYTGGDDSSHNYGGNLEVAPPYETRTASFPFGRLLVGGGSQGTLLGVRNTEHMAAEQLAWLNAQDAQGPALELSSEWLAVGHIDEIFQFVPDRPSAARGGRAFKVVIASPQLARSTLVAHQRAGNGSSVVFRSRRTQTTVSTILNDEDLMAFNDLAQERIDGVQAVLTRALGLDASDFLEVPVLFEDAGGGGLDMAVALNPGIQNLVTLVTGEEGRLFVPDPSGPANASGRDVWQEATRASLADLDLDVVFVDVFNSYHLLLGEAHCGTNVEREPYAQAWWSLQ
jgi:protein-arginine deiminase